MKTRNVRVSSLRMQDPGLRRLAGNRAELAFAAPTLLADAFSVACEPLAPIDFSVTLGAAVKTLASIPRFGF